MNVKISDLMAGKVFTVAPNDCVADVRKLMDQHGIHAVPVLDGDEEIFGIVSTADLVKVVDGSTAVARVATRKVYSIPQYNDISAAARLMRKHRIHHVLVTHEKKLVGILSSFDLLQLVENHRFSVKSGPTPSKRRKGGDPD